MLQPRWEFIRLHDFCVKSELAQSPPLANPDVKIYTPINDAAQAAWSVGYARCIFSECLNESTLHDSSGAPPGVCAGSDAGRAGFRLLQHLVGHTNAIAHTVFDDLVTTAFPSDCRICNRPLLRSAILPVCDDCRSAVPPQTQSLCARCGEALDIDMESARLAESHLEEGLLCDDCRSDAPHFERAAAYALYQGELREMIHLLKYERMSGVAKLLGPLLSKTILSMEHEIARDCIVIPVPLFPSKRRQRGYNQAELLAQAALSELRRSRPNWRLRLVPAILSRQRDTRSQFELSPIGRRRNLRGAFQVHAETIVPGCEVLLIDDIYTSGATARECSRVLRRAGVGKVWVATVARAQKAHVAMWDESRLHAPQGFG